MANIKRYSNHTYFIESIYVKLFFYFREIFYLGSKNRFSCSPNRTISRNGYPPDHYVCNIPGASNRSNLSIIAILIPIECLPSFLVSYGCPPFSYSKWVFYFFTDVPLFLCLRTKKQILGSVRLLTYFNHMNQRI